MANVQPSTFLGTNYNEISAFCNEMQEPVIITKNDGKNDLAVISMEMFETLNGKQELYRLLDEGRVAVKEGRVRPREDVMRDLRQKIKNGAV